MCRSAYVVDVVDVAMPVSGHTGDNQARTVPAQVVRRSWGQRAARRRGGRAQRQGCAHLRYLGDSRLGLL